MHYLLKIFSGPHVGAEVVLPHGETIIGSDEQCDVVLDDCLVAAKHLALTVSDELIECRSLGTEAVLVDGKPVERVAIRPFQYFTIGTTHLAVGPSDKAWPRIDLTDFQLREPVEEEPVDESDEAERETPGSGGAKRTRDAEERAAPKRKLLSPAMVATVVIVGANTLAVVGVMAASWTRPSVADESTTSKSRLEQVVEPYSPHVQVEDDNGGFRLVGYVASDVDRERLLAAAREACPGVAFKVRSSESLLLAVRRRLKQDGWSRLLNAATKGPGVIAVAGNLPNTDARVSARWKETIDRIQAEVPLKQLIVEFGSNPYVVVFNNRPHPASERDASDTPHVGEQNQGTSVAESAGETGPEGLAAEAETGKSGEPRELAAQEAGRRMPVPSPIDGTPNSSLVEPLPILDVRIAHDKVVTLANGRQVSIGGRLPNGLWVVSLELDHAIARTSAGHRLVVPFGIGG